MIFPSGSRFLVFLAWLIVSALPAWGADWRRVAEGVEYREFRANGMHPYVARVDLCQSDLKVLANRES